MDFLASQRRMKYADQPHVRLGTQDVLVMLVQGIDRAGPDRINSRFGLEHLDLTFSLDAVTGLEVIFVPDFGFRTGIDGRFGKGKPHAFLFDDKTAAGPVV